MTSIADPGDPSFLKEIFFQYTGSSLLAFTILFTLSCNDDKQAKAIAKFKADSTQVRTPQQKQKDTIAKTGTFVKMKVYLSFDDGPNKGTGNVYKIVKEENVPATFFIVGKHVFDNTAQEEEWKILQADSTIDLCNHSYTHAANHYSRFYRDPDEVVEDMERNETVLGLKNHIARMPGRNAWRIDSMSHTDVKESRISIDSVQKAGYSIIGWDLEWQFDHTSLAPDADTTLLLRRVQNLLSSKGTRTPGHLVLLAHDQAFQKEEAIQLLQHIIRELKNNPAYDLELLSHYPGVKD